jgi:hypothetical protein
VPEEKLVRFSAKLFNCTPAQLPADLKASLVNMLSCQSMEGYLRPGCVHLTGAATGGGGGGKRAACRKKRGWEWEWGRMAESREEV